MDAVGDFKTSTVLSLQISSDLVSYYDWPPKWSTCDRLLWCYEKKYKKITPNFSLNNCYEKIFQLTDCSVPYRLQI